MESINYDRYVLDWEKVAGTQSVARAVLVDARLDSVEDVMHDGIRYQLTGFILAGAPVNVTASVTIPYPETHWQRLLWFMAAGATTRVGQKLEAWVTDHLPLKRETHTQKVNRNVCPHGVVAKAHRHLEFVAHPGWDIG